MSRSLQELFRNNRQWSARRLEQDPEFFNRLARQQAPQYLWIGCSDSRVPANEIIGLDPGEVFVHRNIANVVMHSDLNCLSVLQFAVDVLKVRHVMVVGHYGCGGVQAVVDQQRVGLTDNWLQHVEDVAYKYASHLAQIEHRRERGSRLVELNVVEQVANVCRTTVVQDAWARNQDLEVHAMVYGIGDGLLRPVGCSVRRGESWQQKVEEAVTAMATRNLPFITAPAFRLDEDA